MPWVPWNSSFEELHGFENTMRKHTTPTLPLQLGIVICYQYESTSFPVPYADNQLFYNSLCRLKGSHTFNSAGSNTTTRFSCRLSYFCNFTLRLHKKRSQKVRNPKFSLGGGGERGGGGMPPRLH